VGDKNVIERFIWFDDRVRSNKYPNATILAEHFEVSIKTAQRDVEFMRERLSFPLVYDKNRKGYFYTDNTFSLPMTYLSSEELSSLLVARKMLLDISGGIAGDEINTIVDKITSILRNHIAEMDAVDKALSFQLIEYSPASDKVFSVVLEGCLRKLSLDMLYYSPAYDRETFRTVDPYYLLNYMGTWYLIAYCHKAKQIRNFVLSRMIECKITDYIFKVKKGFNINEYRDSTFGLFKGKYLTQVVLKFSPELSRRIKSQIWRKDQKTKVLKDGSFQLSFPVAHLSEIKREVLKHGADVEVMEPQALREFVKSEALKIVKKY